jgi:hypothetical protein
VSSSPRPQRRHRLSPHVNPLAYRLIRLFIHPSIHPSIHPPINQSIHPSINQSINPSIHQSINQSTARPARRRGGPAPAQAEPPVSDPRVPFRRSSARSLAFSPSSTAIHSPVAPTATALPPAPRAPLSRARARRPRLAPRAPAGRGRGEGGGGGEGGAPGGVEGGLHPLLLHERPVCDPLRKRNRECSRAARASSCRSASGSRTTVPACWACPRPSSSPRSRPPRGAPPGCSAPPRTGTCAQRARTAGHHPHATPRAAAGRALRNRAGRDCAGLGARAPVVSRDVEREAVEEGRLRRHPVPQRLRVKGSNVRPRCAQTAPVLGTNTSNADAPTPKARRRRARTACGAARGARRWLDGRAGQGGASAPTQKPSLVR